MITVPIHECMCAMHAYCIHTGTSVHAVPACMLYLHDPCTPCLHACLDTCDDCIHVLMYSCDACMHVDVCRVDGCLRLLASLCACVFACTCAWLDVCVHDVYVDVFMDEWNCA